MNIICVNLVFFSILPTDFDWFVNIVSAAPATTTSKLPNKKHHEEEKRNPFTANVPQKTGVVSFWTGRKKC